MSDEQQSRQVEEESARLEDVISDMLELPMFILSVVMLGLLVAELALDLSPDARRWVLLSGSIIWWIFIMEYILRVFLADDRLGYIKSHWVDALFMFVPFLRVFRILSAVRAVRLLRTVRPQVLGKTFVTTRRGLRQLGRVLGKRSFAYVLATTLVVFLISSLIMFLIERDAPRSVIRSYGTAMWWAAGIVTTVGNEVYPVTAEGRILATIVMIYGVGVFGYVAATLASYFVSQDAQAGQKAPEPTPDQLKQLQDISEKVDKLLDAHTDPPKS